MSGNLAVRAVAAAAFAAAALVAPLAAPSETQPAITVMVVGNVREAGRHALPAGSRIADAIVAAGGVPLAVDAYPVARVSDAGGTIRSADLRKVFAGGVAAQNVQLADGAIVYVPGRALLRVRVQGEVSHEGDLDVEDGDRLSMALARAGVWSARDPNLHHIALVRSQAAGSAKAPAVLAYQIDVENALVHGDERFDPVLHAGDRVFVPGYPEQRRRGPMPLGVRAYGDPVPLPLRSYLRRLADVESGDQPLPVSRGGTVLR